ncbi:MAG: hypothetical protein F7B20_01935 [Aeropyrum sp.]|nr:hypothetical protein [Aeropyrum sp.]MCE4616681.1 hypothetical protein [Aeropyrum sp.]
MVPVRAEEDNPARLGHGAPQSLEVPSTPLVSLDAFNSSPEALGDARYRLIYLIMYYSGAPRRGSG